MHTSCKRNHLFFVGIPEKKSAGNNQIPVLCVVIYLVSQKKIDKLVNFFGSLRFLPHHARHEIHHPRPCDGASPPQALPGHGGLALLQGPLLQGLLADPHAAAVLGLRQEQVQPEPSHAGLNPRRTGEQLHCSHGEYLRSLILEALVYCIIVQLVFIIATSMK